MFCRPFLFGILLSLVMTGHSFAAEPYPPDSPEHQALTAASPALGIEEFTLREEYWKGVLSSHSGRAFKLQLFKRNIYRMFLGVSPSALPPGAKLQLNIFDADNVEVLAVTGDPGVPALALEFENTLRSGIYLILMRVEVPPGPLAETEIPAALFYGWE